MELNNRTSSMDGNCDYNTNSYYTNYNNQNNWYNSSRRRSSMKDIIYNMALSKNSEEPVGANSVPKESIDTFAASTVQTTSETVNTNQLFQEYETMAERETNFFDPSSESEDLLMEYKNDYSYMKSLYPLIARQIQEMIEEQLDQLEYSESCMFDKYPDKVHISALINTIYNKALELDKEDPGLQAEEISTNPLTTMSYRRCSGFCCAPPAPLSDYNQYGRPNWMRNLIEIMVYNEMLYRRRRYRNRKCW